MDARDGSYEDQFHAKYREQAEKIGRFNLAVFGKTGVGKSTLINAVFGDEVAATGIGEPVTMDEHLYLHRSGFFGLLDTRGLEIGVDTETLIGELGRYVERMRRQPLSEQIHAAWYCVRATDRRFEDTEAEFVRRLHELGLPVIVVLTQVPSRNARYHADALAMFEHIAGLGLPIEGGRPILVMAQGDDFTGQIQHGVKDLLDATFRAAPEGVSSALAAAQKIDLDRKWKEAQAAITTAGTAAAAVGAIPIPVADAALLVPIQLGLMGSVSAIYGIRPELASVAAIAAATVATTAGRGTVVGLLKLIPGAGIVVGGAVSAATASTFTLAIGYAWATVCSQLTQGRLKGVDGALDDGAVRKLFRSEVMAWFTRLRGGGK
ncbi:50S ribosome-binding GTPase [Leucobacter weissii]|uniref:50S ribosome-binding GTPase n=1 Tax=Leucobacter weissii TaxID=1983706 RepID=A0A939SAA5_9MICO|nr:GTPase [Leucobacter weissii]MBO1901737.1 50S ribosome-binding GTPase [Leucobacter weissii]